MKNVTRVPFGRTSENQPVDLLTLRNANDLEIGVMTYGGVIVSIKTPDRTGALDDIVLGFDDFPSYPAKSRYFGAIIGRYGNRIARGEFTLDGTTYKLATNNGPNALHGGLKGWDKRIWLAVPFQNTDNVGVTLTYTSEDGEEGYPGTVRAKVNYTLTDKNQLIVDYHATTDKPTVINLTQHSYFNLSGTRAEDVTAHELQLHADQFTPVDATLIPTGELASVSGTPFDFRIRTRVGARIDDGHEQIQRGKGYDHNFVLNRNGAGLVPAASMIDPLTGRTLEVATTEPGMQFYSGNFLDGSIQGKGGRRYGKRSGFCFETQHFPDSPHHANFPSTVLRPGEELNSRTIFTFGVTT
jgi:aldose 1-epimerase